MDIVRALYLFSIERNMTLNNPSKYEISLKAEKGKVNKLNIFTNLCVFRNKIN